MKRWQRNAARPVDKVYEIMHVFIDSNIFVGFYELSSDSLDELEKLIAVVKGGDTKLWLPEQTKREFWKNRERQIKKHVQDFEQHRAVGVAPLLVRESPDYGELVKRAKGVDELRGKMAALVREQVDTQSAPADKIIRKLFDCAILIDTDADAVFNAALRRAQCHLPPGKGDDLGDRLNWVALLDRLPEGAQLHIVSADTDFRNEGFSDDIRPYLNWEWEHKKKGTVKLWSRISQFLAAHYLDAKSALELEREIVAHRLRHSGGFSTTHAVIAELSKLDGFSDKHVRVMAEAIIENDQVRLIHDDADVRNFYEQLIENYGASLDKDLRSSVEELLKDDD